MSSDLGSLRSATTARRLVLIIVATTVAAVCALPASALASATYDLTGTWDTYSVTGGGYTGTFTITSMNLATGKFSGTGDGTSFDLEGTESGSSVTFTQSSGGYVATDTATVQPTSSGFEMVNGTWSDTNNGGGTFYASVTSAQRGSPTAVSCAAGATATAPLNCTTTVSDTSGTSPAEPPSGVVTVSANDGTLATTSCTLAATTASAAACTVAYTPPANVANGSANPVITANYSGDAQFSPGTGSQTITCTSGLIFQLAAITSTEPSTNGYRVGEPATLHGCGLTAQTTARFGDDDATVKAASASDVGTDGTTVTVTVPTYAITGPVSVTDPAYPTAGTVTLTTPNPVPIDSWRNTNGFSFKNYAGTLTESELLAEFPTSDLTLGPTGPDPVLKPWADAFLQMRQKTVVAGVCYGLALMSGEVADGFLTPDSIAVGANTAFDLSRSSFLDQIATEDWLGQFSDETQQYRVAGPKEQGSGGHPRSAEGDHGRPGRLHPSGPHRLSPAAPVHQAVPRPRRRRLRLLDGR